MTKSNVKSFILNSIMGSRAADDPSMTPSQRKRPLSIIEEHDSSDDAVVPEVPGTARKTLQTKENDAPVETYKPGIIEPSPSVQAPPIHQKHNVSGQLTAVEQGLVKNSTQKNPSKNKHLRDLNTKTTPSTVKSKPNSTTHIISSSDIKVPGWKKKKQRAPKKNTVSPSLSDPTVKPFQDKSQATKPQRGRKKNQETALTNQPNSFEHAAPSQDHTSSSLNTTSKVVVDSQGLARIREAAERLNLTSASSAPSSPSPKFSHKLRPPSEPPRLEGCYLSGDVIPLITITSSSGTYKLSSEDDVSSVIELQNRNQIPAISGRIPFITSKYPSSKYNSSYFTRRVRTDSIGSISEGELSEGSAGINDSFEETNMSGSDLKRLQETTEKLHLSPRRPSIMQWRQKYIESPETPKLRKLSNETTDERLTTDRKQRINEALDWLRNELQEMRSQDQTLARQLLSIRQDLHKLKLRRCTEQHQELIDDYQSELEDLHEFSCVLDLPKPVYGNNPLKHIGVTRLNLSARRFSAC